MASRSRIGHQWGGNHEFLITRQGPSHLPREARQEGATCQCIHTWQSTLWPLVTMLLSCVSHHLRKVKSGDAPCKHILRPAQDGHSRPGRAAQQQLRPVAAGRQAALEDMRARDDHRRRPHMVSTVPAAYCSATHVQQDLALGHLPLTCIQGVDFIWCLPCMLQVVVSRQDGCAPLGRPPQGRAGLAFGGRRLSSATPAHVCEGPRTLILPTRATATRQVCWHTKALTSAWRLPPVARPCLQLNTPQSLGRTLIKPSNIGDTA